MHKDSEVCLPVRAKACMIKCIHLYRILVLWISYQFTFIRLNSEPVILVETPGQATSTEVARRLQGQQQTPRQVDS